MMQILELLKIGSNKLKDYKIPSHELDAELILSKILKKKRENLLVNLSEVAKKCDIKSFNNLNVLGNKNWW